MGFASKVVAGTSLATSCSGNFVSSSIGAVVGSSLATSSVVERDGGKATCSGLTGSATFSDDVVEVGVGRFLRGGAARLGPTSSCGGGEATGGDVGIGISSQDVRRAKEKLDSLLTRR